VVNRLALLHAYNDTALFDAIINGLIMIAHGAMIKRRCWSSPTGWITRASRR
jgi:hypothetical protein